VACCFFRPLALAALPDARYALVVMDKNTEYRRRAGEAQDVADRERSQTDRALARGFFSTAMMHRTDGK
jgi:hypothetical protein